MDSPGYVMHSPPEGESYATVQTSIVCCMPMIMLVVKNTVENAIKNTVEARVVVKIVVVYVVPSKCSTITSTARCMPP